MAETSSGDAGEVREQSPRRRQILEALARSGGNRTRAAEKIGISRRTLHRKINEYGIRPDTEQQQA